MSSVDKRTETLKIQSEEILEKFYICKAVSSINEKIETLNFEFE